MLLGRGRERGPTRADVGSAVLSTVLLVAIIFGGVPEWSEAKTTQPARPASAAQQRPTPPSGSGADTTGPEAEPETEPSAEFTSHHLLVKLKAPGRASARAGDPAQTGLPSLDAIHRAHGVKGFEQLAKRGQNARTDHELFGWYVVTLDGVPDRIKGRFNAVNGDLRSAAAQAAPLARLIAAYRADPDVEAVDLDYVVTVDIAPNDPYYASTGSWGQSYPDLWGLKKIGAEAAWDRTTGSASIVIADIDTGVDRNHPDLQPNMWVNTREVPGNGVDDDANGYVDDYHGWDWANNDNDPMDDNGHGTHTVGTIAAAGNNGQGVAGLNWTSKVMALKFLDRNGSGPTSGGIKALQYAADMGARVASNSWGCQCQSPALEDAVRYAHARNVVVVAAAGNSNIDALDFSPASADAAITVAASSSADTKASFSNWGEKIDVAAPGVDILSTRSSQDTLCAPRGYVVNTSYCRLSGTSMATPHVAGLAGLLLAADPTLSSEEVRQLLRHGAADLGTTGKDASFGYGRIAAGGSLALASIKPLTPVLTSPRSRTVVSGTALVISGSVAGAGFASYKVEAGSGRAPSAWTALTTSTSPVTNGLLATVDTTRLPDGPTIFRLTAIDTGGRIFQYQVNDVVVDNFDAEISLPQVLVARGVVDVLGSATTKNGLAFSSFRLEWGAGASPTSYTSAGITLAGGGGTQSVQQGILGRWDTTGLPEGQSHTLRLTVTGATGVTAQAQVAVVPDANLINGWPKRLNAALPLTSLPVSVPALADLDGDGTSEIILLETGGSVHVVRKNGAAYPGFPVSVGSGWYPNMPANVADLDGDGKPEIVLSVSDNSWTRKVVVLRSDGTSYPGWPEPRYSDASLGDGTPAAADLDGDGKKELIFADRTGQLHALRLDGRAAVGFPRQVFPSTASAIRPSLTVTEPRPGERPSIVVAVDGALYMLDSAGNVMPGWPVQTPTVGGSALAFVSGASVGDVDGNGFAEVYAVASTAYCAGCEAYVYGFDHSGAILPGWPRAVGVVRYNSAPVNRPALADVDGDAQLEVIAATDRVYVHGVGGLEASGGAGAVAPAVADVDGNGVPDVATAYDRNITVIAGSGATLWQRTFPTVAASGNAFSTPLVLGDLDGNGTVEMVALWSPFGSSNAYVYAIAWELPRSGSATGPQGWPIFGHGPGRSGVLIAQTGVAPAPTASSTPAAPSTPAPSSTPVATATLSATATPVPSNTPVPSPSPTRTSSPTSTAAPSDKLPPTVSIASPLNGSTVARNATVTIAGLASDDVGIARVEFYVNGALLCSAASPPQSCTWKVPSRNRATYTIEARAYDIAGNTATTSVRVTAQ